MRVAGIDASLTACGWAVGEEGRIESGVYRPKGRGVRRLHEALHHLVARITQGCDIVVLEGYAYAAANSAHQIGELGGVLRLGWHQKSVPVVEIAPPKLKKFGTGKGNAKKGAMLAEAIRRLGYAGSSHDEADALWLLQMGLHHFTLPGAVELPQAHLAALQGVDWPVIEHLEF